MSRRFVMKVLASLIAGLALFLGGSAMVAAQPAAPASPVAPQTPDTAPFEGQVVAYLLTPDAGVAGLLLEDGRQVRVPPRLGAALADLVKPGQGVRVGASEPNPAGRGPAPMRSITATATGRQLGDPSPEAAPPRAAPPDGAAPLHPLKTSGTVRYTLFGPRGEPNGVVLDNGVQVAFPPHVMREAGDRLVAGKPVDIQGYGRTSAYGTIVQATAISSPGAATLTIYGPAGGP